jgi:hypothetical protein
MVVGKRRVENLANTSEKILKATEKTAIIF